MLSAFPAAGKAQDIMPSGNERQPEDYEKRLELAKRVEEFRPMEDRVSEVLDVLAPELGADDRERFKNDVTATVNMDRLEELSVATMARLFTPEELQSMIDYYQVPASRTVAEKTPMFRQIVDAEIGREIQFAINRLADTLLPPEATTPPEQIQPPTAPPIADTQ